MAKQPTKKTKERDRSAQQILLMMAPQTVNRGIYPFIAVTLRLADIYEDWKRDLLNATNFRCLFDSME